MDNFYTINPGIDKTGLKGKIKKSMTEMHSLSDKGVSAINRGRALLKQVSEIENAVIPTLGENPSVF